MSAADKLTPEDQAVALKICQEGNDTAFHEAMAELFGDVQVALEDTMRLQELSHELDKLAEKYGVDASELARDEQKIIDAENGSDEEDWDVT